MLFYLRIIFKANKLTNFTSYGTDEIIDTTEPISLSIIMVLLQGLCYVVDITMVFLTFIGIFNFVFHLVELSSVNPLRKGGNHAGCSRNVALTWFSLVPVHCLVPFIVTKS